MIIGHCPTCDTVRMKPQAVTLVVSDELNISRYSFTCPKCSEAVACNARPALVAWMVFGGVTMQRPPFEVAERPSGPPITTDDILAFHNALYERANSL